MKVTTRLGGQGAEPGEDAGSAGGGQPNRNGVLALMALALILIAAFFQLSPSMSTKVVSEVSSLLATTLQSTTSNSTSQTFHVYAPLIVNGSANVAYPSNYKTLADYTLNLINQDRANFSLPPVSLSGNKAGQQHANSMLTFAYFSHYDTQGFKPYMRYSLLGGLGAVAENVAYISWESDHFTSTTAVESSISALEHAMIYNDSQCCNNGHRLNIINPLHNRVSLGLAFNGTTLYFVEEFENYYIDMNFSVSKSYTVTMTGPLVLPFGRVSQVYVTYDRAPASETAVQLNSGPKEYDPGILVGGVLPPCSEACTAYASGITVRAEIWQVTSAQVDFTFDLGRFIQVYGNGVYTIYMLTGADTSTALTSISVFVG